MKALTLFSSAGVGEAYFKDINIEAVCSCEILEKRASFYKHLYPETNVINGDIRNKDVKNEISNFITDDVKLLIATPPSRCK